MDVCLKGALLSCWYNLRSIAITLCHAMLYTHAQLAESCI